MSILGWISDRFRHAPAASAAASHDAPTIAPRSDTPIGAEELCARFEGFSPSPYRCPAGVWTIGYGTTRYPDGQPVREGDAPVSMTHARELLAHDLAGAEAAVARLVTVPLNKNERAALVSFTYNVGTKALSGSTLLLRLNKGDRIGAAGEFQRWCKGGGKVLPGLVKRRAEEANLFQRPA